jgi:phosphodiesterase/alkaline phosphatase D-like protein
MHGGRAAPILLRSASQEETAIGVCSMNGLLVKLAITATAGILLFSNPIVAQIPPPQKRAEHVEITKAPELESAHDDAAIIRWTTTNPRGDDEHYGIVHYGTDPEDLSQTAKGHIRLNRTHPETIFRVRMQDLKPQTTYYYKVTSMGSGGQSDGVESAVNHFTTPAPGDRIVNYPADRSLPSAKITATPQPE